MYGMMKEYKVETLCAMLFLLLLLLFVGGGVFYLRL